MLTNGLTLEWETGSPPSYFEKNNKSALDHLSQLRDTVFGWERDGFVSRLHSPAFCCSPLTVAVQHNAMTNVTKYRPCIDLSRHVNRYIKKQTVKLDDLSVAQELIDKSDFMAAFDLENQFFQVKLATDMKKYFGFSVPAEDGTDQFFHFNVMAYGVTPAVWVVTRLLRPLKAFFHRNGVKMSIYVDDGRISASTFSLCQAQFCFVLHVLQLAGWRIQWKKTTVTPTTSLLHLGFVTDSVSMQYTITHQKWDGIVFSMNQLLNQAQGGQLVAVKSLASLLGKLNSLHRSHGSVTHVMSRHLQHQLGCHVDSVGWTGSLLLHQDSVNDLRSLLLNLSSFDCRFIPTQTTKSIVFDLTATASAKLAVAVGPSLTTSLSSAYSFILSLDGSLRSVLEYPEDFSSLTSPFVIQELLALASVLCDQFSASDTACLVYWQTCSHSVVFFLRRGSRILIVNQLVLVIKRLEKIFSIVVIPVWTPTASVAVTFSSTAFSLNASSDEWSIRREDLARVFAALHFFPDVDCFASSYNAICPTYFSISPQLDSSGVNFFSQILTTGHSYFCCPPVSRVTAAFHHILRFSGVHALLIFPDWSSAAFWSSMHPSGQPHRFVSRRITFRPRFFSTNSARCIFTSGSHFSMVAFLIHTPL